MAAHKMKDGRWCIWLDLGSDPVNGKRLRKKIEAKTKREAESKATTLRERHQRGEDITLKPRTLSQLPDEWIATIAQEGKAVNTIKSYRGAITNQLTPQIGGALVPQLRTRALQLVFNDYAKTLAPTYIRLIKTVLVAALDLAIEQNEISINPAEKVRIPTVKRTPGRSFSPSEVRAPERLRWPSLWARGAAGADGAPAR